VFYCFYLSHFIDCIFMKSITTMLFSLFSLFGCMAVHAQKIKVENKTKTSSFVSYPEEPFSYEFLEYKLQINPDNTKINFVMEGKELTSVDITAMRTEKIRTDAKNNRLVVGNLQMTQKTGAGILLCQVEFLPMTLEGITTKSGNAWENIFKNSFVLNVPLKVTYSNSFDNKVIEEDTIVAQYVDRGLADLIVERDQLMAQIATTFPNKKDAMLQSLAFLKQNYTSMTLSIFDNLIGHNQIAGFWNRNMTKKQMRFQSTGSLFFTRFKDKNDPKQLEYNEQIDKLILLADDINKSAYDKNKVDKSSFAAVAQIAEYLEKELTGVANEDIKIALQTDLLYCYLIASNFDKAIPVMEELKSKNKLNLKMNGIWEQLPVLAEAKKNFEENKGQLSATYSDALNKMMN